MMVGSGNGPINGWQNNGANAAFIKPADCYPCSCDCVNIYLHLTEPAGEEWWDSLSSITYNCCVDGQQKVLTGTCIKERIQDTY